MPRTARAGFLETRTARLKLAPAHKPYWARSGKAGVHLGYRRRKPYGRDANGSWLARRYVDGGYQTDVFAEADDFTEADGSAILTYQQAIAKLGAQLSEVQRRTRYTVKNAVDDYISQLRLNNPTAKEAEGLLKHYLLRFFDPDRPLSDLTREDFARWPAWAMANPPAGRRKKAAVRQAVPADEASERERKRKERVNRVLNNVLACLNRAYADDRVPSNMAWSRLKRFKGTDQARKRWLDVIGCQRLMNACSPDFRKTVQAALLTGARWSELRQLRAGDYDGAAGTVLIAKAKSGTARHVYLTKEGNAAFAEWTAGLENQALIFTRANGEHWGSHDQHRPMRAACPIAKIVPPVGFHALRHSYASILVKKGVSLPIVAEALGHSGTRMVERHYGHLAPSHVAATIRQKLPKFGVEVSGKVRSLRP
jgi:integrase